MTASKRWSIAQSDAKKIEEIIKEFGVCHPIAMTLANKGLSLPNIGSFLQPQLRDLIDPYSIKAIKPAVDRLWQAIVNKEKILIFGDYDTDGITSTALLAWVLEMNGAILDCFLPNRIEDGYGLTEETITKSVNDHKVLVTVDCGITSCAATETASGMGIDVIITDHHEPGDAIPDALAVINPKLHEELQYLHNLAGVGVCFKLCHAFIKYGRENNLGGNSIDLKDGLDLVALGTVADIVPLTGENRCLVKHGMAILKSQRRPGVRALCEISGIREAIVASDISFRLAPRINAAGRLGDAYEALKLLQTSRIIDAYPTAKILNGYNKKRQNQESKMFQIAERRIHQMNLAEKKVIIIAEKNWHQGIIGIVAAKIMHKFHRPALVLSILENGEIMGSGRSVTGIDLVEVLNECGHFLLHYGGHAMAVGLSLYKKNLVSFINTFEDVITKLCEKGFDFTPKLAIDGDVLFSEMDSQFSSELDQLQPFGHCNTPPVFRYSNIRSDRLILAGDKHTRGTIFDEHDDQMPFIAFGRRPEEFPESPWDIAGMPQHNYYNGSQNLQIQILDLIRAR